MTDKQLGLFALAVSLLILFVWIPLDVDSGIIEKARRSTVLGDSFAPAVAAALVAIGACLLFIERREPVDNSSSPVNEVSADSRASANNAMLSDKPSNIPSHNPSTNTSRSPSYNTGSGTRDTSQYLQRENLIYLFTTIVLLTVSLAVMRYAGPLLVTLIGDEGVSYRLLRDTPPWKYIGFVAGGVLLITSLISRVERRFRFRFLLIGIAAVVVLIAVYDLPFDDLLLPPNGDV